ncbi:DUF4189 domain-containing protein [Xanthomonas campestris pv. campestris]|uniref:DUF4189 domain-containing protein n=1 Tax=Xanthomonas campestris TaxID=339 RepID=UPI002368324A|nr:DUF4189 domain-containing protein [Xanthomonas campestris]WDJ97375.1 DUF4189 domain-containing protein [Xanthomonas campestris pv. incanae]
MKNLAFLALLIILISSNLRAEQGCPPGQIPAQSNGSMSSCGPIPAGYYQEQPAASPRPSGKWIKTWGAIATDGAENLGVSTGKLKKSDAEQDALEKCAGASKGQCHILQSYKNQCAAIAEPTNRGSFTRSFARGPSIETASKDAFAHCKEKNPNAECKVIYQECSDPIFKAY